MAGEPEEDVDSESSSADRPFELQPIYEQVYLRLLELQFPELATTLAARAESNAVESDFTPEEWAFLQAVDEHLRVQNERSAARAEIVINVRTWIADKSEDIDREFLRVFEEQVRNQHAMLLSLGLDKVQSMRTTIARYSPRVAQAYRQSLTKTINAATRETAPEEKITSSDEILRGAVSAACNAALTTIAQLNNRTHSWPEIRFTATALDKALRIDLTGLGTVLERLPMLRRGSKSKEEVEVAARKACAVNAAKAAKALWDQAAPQG